jgi:hypothetical protein
MILNVKIACLFVLLVTFGALLAEDKPSKAFDENIHTLELPSMEPKPVPGPNVEVYTAACITCHSMRYVLMQPVLSEKKWNDEVTKMIKVFGAPIKEEQAQQIVKYLVAVNTEKK